VETSSVEPGRGRSGEKEFSIVKKSARSTLRTHNPAFKVRQLDPFSTLSNAPFLEH
jgi:hypothetical protein